MAKQLSESSRQEKLRLRKKPAMTPELMAELAAVEAMTDDEIDASDIPEQLDWGNAEIGKFYRPIKTQISLRVDADVLDWFKAKGKQYTPIMNRALRAYMMAEKAVSKRKVSYKTMQDKMKISKQGRRKHA